MKSYLRTARGQTMKAARLISLIICIHLGVAQYVFCQTGHGARGLSYDSAEQVIDSAPPEDLVNALNKAFGVAPTSAVSAPKRFMLSVMPGAGYSLSTGWAAVLSSNASFYTSSDRGQHISSVTASFTYTSLSQKNLNILSNIWTPDNRFMVVGDWKYLIYPQTTYGLGTFSKTGAANALDFSYIRLYETVLKRIENNWFVGGGYNLDYHFHIRQQQTGDVPASDFTRYGFASRSVSSGANLTLLYDGRSNQLNPKRGSYVSLVFRPNFTFLGSDQNWQSAVVDARKYIKLSDHSNNVLAFWGLAWLTLGGNPPYLDLPSTGWDAQFNTGRGYIQGRFRGKDMLYFETEYRFDITRNGLFGGVVFANAQSFTGFPNNQFEGVMPAAGAGLRMKLNKQSGANICIDYGIGLNGSRGFFVNLGEVF